MTTQQPAAAPTHIRHYSQDDIARLKQLVTDGCTVKQETQDLTESLNETIKAIAEEMDIKPSVLKKVINVAFKRSRDEERVKFEELEDILDTLGL